MGVFSEYMFAVSEYDTDESTESARDRAMRKAGEDFDRREAKQAKVDAQRALLLKAPEEHDDATCESNPCHDCLIEGFEADSEHANEQRAEDWFHSGQPMGPDDY